MDVELVQGFSQLLALVITILGKSENISAGISPAFSGEPGPFLES